MQPSSLPDPDVDSAEHSARVAAFLRERIDTAGGLLSFAEFMQHALYAPGLGYYSAGTTKFGAAGEFVTAPEVSSVFGYVLATQCADVLATMESPSILEFGAGSGRLAADILCKLNELNALPSGGYHILEVSADLRQRQESMLQDAVPACIDVVHWLDRLPAEHRGIVIANEVLDALPVERFACRGGDVRQVCVATERDAFVMTERAAPAQLRLAVQSIESDLGRPLPDGYVSDICLAAPHWIATMASSLREGLVLLFDYGVSRREYYADDRAGGWLRCHFRHRVHDDPLLLPGIQDLTAWVDFTAIASAAVDAGLDIAGYVTQAQFLIGGGLHEQLSQFQELPTDAQLELSRQVKLLTLPGEMGESFKCLGLSRGEIVKPPALGLADRTIAL